MLDATVRPEPHFSRGFDLEGLSKQSIGKVQEAVES
jgi:hypothetical protein